MEGILILKGGFCLAVVLVQCCSVEVRRCSCVTSVQACACLVYDLNLAVCSNILYCRTSILFLFLNMLGIVVPAEQVGTGHNG